MNDLTRYRLLDGASLPLAAKLVYCYLLNLAGGKNSPVWLSSRRLVADIGLSPSMCVAT